MKNKFFSIIAAFLLAGCASTSRSCDSGMAESFGADWIVVQYQANGEPINCWMLHNESVTNEPASDGIYWTQNGNLIHISGWYNRIQVTGGNYAAAATLLGIDSALCKNGKYIVNK